MSYVRASANLVVDNPHADGRITQWGIGRDWVAAEPRQGAGPGFAADVAGQYGWEYQNTFEYIDKLRGIAPIGVYTEVDMALDGWTVLRGKWKESSTAATLQHKYLHFYDARPGLGALGEWGQIKSNADFAPNFEMHIWRFPPDRQETDAANVTVAMHGDGIAPSYCIVLPSARVGKVEGVTSSEDKLNYPQLWGRPQGGNWALIDTFTGTGLVNRPGQQADWQAMRVEYTAGWMLVRFAGTKETWAYTGSWLDAAGVRHSFALTAGPLEIQVCGHTAMFNVGALSYPTEATLKPSVVFVTGNLINPTPQYRYIYHAPAGNTLTITAESLGGGKRPQVVFAGPGTSRAVLYNVQEYRSATIGGASSVPVESQGNEDFALTSISGELNSKWRGATLEATVKARTGKTIPAFKGNSKLVAKVTLDPSDAAIWYTLFTGYLTPQERFEEAGALGKVQHTLHATDWLESRGKHKVMYWHSSYEGWPIRDAFEYILNRAGVPASLISVDDSVTGNLPLTNPQGDRGLQFRPDESVVSALDKIAQVCGLRWGVKQDGTIFLGPQYAHVAGHYDFTLDDTTTEASHFKSFRHVRGTDDYFNVLAALVGEGFTSAGRIYMDTGSIGTEADENFIGDDWWRFEGNPEADSLDLAMTRLWASRAEGAHLIYFRLTDHPELLPDQEVRVRVTNSGVTQNSIFRITRKSWSLTDPLGAARFEQELEAVKVEEGIPDA